MTNYREKITIEAGCALGSQQTCPMYLFIGNLEIPGRGNFPASCEYAPPPIS